MADLDLGFISRRRRVALSQVNARQKLRRLIRMAFAATPTQTWLASALMLGVSTNALFAQAPQTNPTGAQQTISDRAVPPTAPQVGAVAGMPVVATPAIPPDMILRWLNQSADAASKQDIQVACANFAEAYRGWKMLPSPNEQVNARMGEVEKLLRAQNVRKQQLQDAINALRPIDQSVAANRGGGPSPAAPQASIGLASAGLVPPPPLNFPQGLPQIPSGLQNSLGSSNPAPVVSATGSAASSGRVQPGVFNPGSDLSRLQAAAAQSNPKFDAIPSGASGEDLYRMGLEALAGNNRDRALELFRRAWKFQGEMDPALRTQLKDKLASLQAGEGNQGGEQVALGGLEGVNQELLLNRSRLMSEITGEIAAAEQHRAEEPLIVAERLQALRLKVSQADLDGATRKQMLSIVDRAMTAHQLFMTQNRSAIDQNMRNRQVHEAVALEQEETYKIDQQVASLTETYNDLMEEGRFSEAEVVAKQVNQLKPNSTIATLLMSNARISRRDAEYNRTRTLKQDNFIDLLNDVDRSSIAPTDNQPFVFGGDARHWNDLTNRRSRLSKAEEQGFSAASAMIYEKLKQTVQVDFKSRPLSEVVKVLSDMTGIVIHIDQAGLVMEGLTPDQPVSLSLGSSQISLRTVLSLLLKPHNLDYHVQDEVLLITSARSTKEANRTWTYSVKDLVIPIPNFVSDYNSGLGGALRAAYETLGTGLAANTMGAPRMAPNMQMAGNVDANGNVLGQFAPGGIPGAGMMPGMGGGMFPWNSNNGPVSGSNPGFMQAGAIPIQAGPAPAKYDDLMSLIQQTIEPDSWQSNGGSSTITPFAGNLSLVVSAPQTTHEKLADLLASLRRLQDLQVTIEVRFITLNDNFFERMGVDFDFKIDDNARGLPQEDTGRSVTVGLSQNFGTTLAPTADLDLTFSQDSFTITPPFGGTTTSQGNFGFAILSDIEMFFFLQAAQGDQRTSVLQAPRVTMFDGQQANITDQIQRPFVVSLIPVVGDFAVGQQPVIVVINEGTTLNVQSVVSQDKRFVRLTLNPTFSRIDRVEQFTFQGTTTSKTGSAIIDPATGRPTTTRNNEEIETTGTTVQQPVLATTSVNTTVSVPDGGTILLGGIKRMSEGRIERGIPILSKIPYVNRLFKNTAIGRQTSTLMLTVTPRIIIQEEEEQLLLGNTGP